jgi:hypothetical protein
MKESFVYDGIEVTKTGREAIKELKSAISSKPSRKMVLVEITPFDGDVGDWKKWVDPSHLYVIGSSDK